MVAVAEGRASVCVGEGFSMVSVVVARILGVEEAGAVVSKLVGMQATIIVHRNK
jgi:non-canonical (house-cleaning) NTP pyrophosphatase